jgi:hypothetical protein
MTTERRGAIEKRIQVLKQRLVDIGNMRPGTLGIQYRNPAEQKTPFHQISYTHKGRSRSEYVRPANLPKVRQEIEAYKRFKAILTELLDLSIQASRIRCGTRPIPSNAITKTT